MGLIRKRYEVVAYGDTLYLVRAGYTVHEDADCKRCSNVDVVAFYDGQGSFEVGSLTTKRARKDIYVTSLIPVRVYKVRNERSAVSKFFNLVYLRK